MIPIEAGQLIVFVGFEVVYWYETYVRDLCVYTQKLS